ncbi:hypothetical protein FRB99_000578 [Tulasnella sp. 403]|nr:hypothetical protein FRB99_000578 [Tulasnella sp. 403]
MLASLSQFIRDTSSSISPSISQRLPTSPLTRQPPPNETDIASTTSTTDHDDKQTDHDNEPDPKAEKRRRERRSTVVYETFIVVRPPPSMSNHPLNLQLQLVPPSTRDARQSSSITRASQSADSSEQAQQEYRQRSPSLRSNRSQTSLYSATSLSTASIASSASSTARRIIPLYNLSAHNVLTNTVTDAGTDAKVAKFGKRGIEVIGLGVLECFEVIGVFFDPYIFQLHKAVPNGGLSPQKSVLPLKDTSSTQTSNAPSTPTPSSSNSHLSDNNPTPTHTPLVSTNPTTPTPNSAKKLFGKMFRKKDATTSPATPGSPTPSTPPTPTPGSSFFRPSKRNASATPDSNAKPTPTPSIHEPPVNAASGSLQTPVLGTQATLLYRTNSRSTVIPPSIMNTITANLSLQSQKSRSKSSFQADDLRLSRDPGVSYPEHMHDLHLAASPPSGPHPYKRTSHSYEWVIRKWIKGSDSGLFGIKESIMSARSAVFSGLDSPMPGGSAEGRSDEVIEVRFEWVRGKGSKERARAKEHARLERDEESSPRAAYPRQRPKSTIVGHEINGVHRSSVYSTTTDSPGTPQLQKRKSLSASSPGTVASSAAGRSSPVRPSMESLRRSSDGSGENPPSSLSHTTSSPAAAPTTTTSVYKGERSKKRRQASSIRDDTDEESDPEDSETPWTCTLYVGPMVRPTVMTDPRGRPSVSSSRSAGMLGSHTSLTEPGHVRLTTSASAQFPSSLGSGVQTHVRAATEGAEGYEEEGRKTVKLKLATMTPAPHHPKVVSHLKMPFPLPDVNVDRLEVVPNDERGQVPAEDLVLTMEEIKDVVCVTGLWLVVREGFGGLERRRKGDGWKIRG